jgi:hypothetical protein
MQVAGWDLSISRRAPPQTCEVANVGVSLRILWPLLLLLVVTISCGEDDSSGTKWGGTYGVPDEFGGGFGSVSFVVESNDEIFCFKFSGAQSSYSTACNNPAADGFPFYGTQFSIPVSTGHGTFTLEGQFISSTQATGDILESSSSPAIVPVLNWTATVVESCRERAWREGLECPDHAERAEDQS